MILEHRLRPCLPICFPHITSTTRPSKVVCNKPSPATMTTTVLKIDGGGFSKNFVPLGPRQNPIKPLSSPHQYPYSSTLFPFQPFLTHQTTLTTQTNEPFRRPPRIKKSVLFSMGKIFHDAGTNFKAGIRGIVVGAAVAGCSIQYWLNSDYKAVHDDELYKGWSLLLAIFLILSVLEGVLFCFACVQILPKGLFFVIELIGDFVCAVLGIVGGAYNISDCSTKLGEACFLNSTRPPMYIQLGCGIACVVVFILTALKK